MSRKDYLRGDGHPSDGSTFLPRLGMKGFEERAKLLVCLPLLLAGQGMDAAAAAADVVISAAVVTQFLQPWALIIEQQFPKDPPGLQTHGLRGYQLVPHPFQCAVVNSGLLSPRCVSWYDISLVKYIYSINFVPLEKLTNTHGDPVTWKSDV